MSLLEIDELCVSYGAVKALRGVSLRVDEGRIVALIGSNGAGKSTTLRAISGLVRPTSGRIRFAGETIERLPCHKIVARGVIQCPEGRGIFANMSVYENLSLGAHQRRDREVEADREKALELFPRLKERLRQNAGTLSGGEQQMLAIARALMARPRLLLLDEPSLGLAPQVTQTIFRIIREINAAGTTILLVEQNAHMALDAAHDAYVLEVGEVVLADRADVLAASDEVRKRYLGIGH
jgi:branched-chain amino acid transport system ATP-binding protein